MGAWGISNFENDAAGDWLYDFSENSTIDFLTETIEAVFKEEYIESDISSATLAAIESIALIKGDSNEDIDELEGVKINKIKKSLNAEIFKKCILSIDKILSKENNELYELWEESESFEDWINEVKDLRNRIQRLETRSSKSGNFEK